MTARRHLVKPDAQPCWRGRRSTSGEHGRSDGGWQTAAVHAADGRPLRRGLVAAGRRLPDLSPSFADRDGDGIGDLPGIVDHLDHVVSLGVEAIWLSPIYPSPGRDVGYDVSDHTAVDPRLRHGWPTSTASSTTAHRRGLRVILDLVMNHTERSSTPGSRRAAAVPRRPVRGLVPVGRPGRPRRRRRAAAAQQLAVVLRRPGLGVGAAAPAVLPAHVPGGATRPELAAARRSRPPSGRWSGAGWIVASTGSAWTSSTRSSSTRSSCSPTR